MTGSSIASADIDLDAEKKQEETRQVELSRKDEEQAPYYVPEDGVQEAPRVTMKTWFVVLVSASFLVESNSFKLTKL
jgi:hypothetical protein